MPKKWEWEDLYDVPRDCIGYGPSPPDPKWPNDAKVAVSFVINYEEGGEHTVLNGDDRSEAYLTEAPGGTPKQQARSTTAESQYDYGSRTGIWRLLGVFERYGLKGTFYSVGRALELNPTVSQVCKKMGWEMGCHGWRWIDYFDMSIEEEKRDHEKCIDLITEQTGLPPRGWYVGTVSPRTHTLLYQIYKERNIPLLWNSDNYGDDLPFWRPVPKAATGGEDAATLVVPYSLDCNDFKFSMPNNWSSPDDFCNYLKGAFDELYAEGQEGSPKMMSIGLHARISGKPGRVGAVRRFVEYVLSKPNVWVATREEIAKHWMELYPYKP